MAKNPPNLATAGGSRGIISQHGVSIFANGIRIGAIKTWTPAARTRAIGHVFEINTKTSGEPIDLNIGNTGGYTINVSRYELTTSAMETAFSSTGVSASVDELLENLSNHKDPLTLTEYWLNPDATPNRTYGYFGCYFSSIGVAAIDASSTDRLIMTNAVITYLKKKLINSGGITLGIGGAGE